MLREEAIKELERAVDVLDHQCHMDNRRKEAFNMAIKALSVEPCEDTISRQVSLDAFGLSEKTRKYGGDHSGYDTMMLYEIQDVIEDLPSVTPKQKMGRWIEGRKEVYKCSACGNHALEWGGKLLASSYCPWCGAKMEESEDTECSE